MKEQARDVHIFDQLTARAYDPPNPMVSRERPPVPAARAEIGGVVRSAVAAVGLLALCGQLLPRLATAFSSLLVYGRR